MAMCKDELFYSDSYTDGRTKQTFKDETDINKLVAKAARGESLSHLEKHGEIYGDFTDISDLLHAHNRLQRGQEVFDALPSELRREFNNSIEGFFNFVNDPANSGRLNEVLPALAEPGRQMPVINRTPETIEVEAPAAAEPPLEPPAATAPADPLPAE